MLFTQHKSQNATTKAVVKLAFSRVHEQKFLTKQVSSIKGGKKPWVTRNEDTKTTKLKFLVTITDILMHDMRNSE